MPRPMKPDYHGGSIVNLMASIAKHYGVSTSYPALHSLPPSQLQKRTVLVIIDGMGYDFLRKYGKDTFLAQHIRTSMTSVFPPTTAAAITTFYTGVAPQQHGYTGWFMNLKEAGGVHTILRFTPWTDGTSLAELGFSTKKVLGVKPLSDRMRIASAAINPSYLVDTAYTKYIVGRSKQYGAKNTPGPKGIASLFKSAHAALRHARYVTVYWDWLDHTMHENGYSHTVVRKHLRAIDDAFRKFVAGCKDTTIIVTADHGQMISARAIHLADHPALARCLALPLSGEPRAAYCYVRAHKTAEFLRYVKTRLSKYCTVVRSDKLIKDGWYGLGKQHPFLEHRVGDYVLIMKEGYAIYDRPHGERRAHVGNHGGVSAEEMLVPLIVVQT